MQKPYGPLRADGSGRAPDPQDELVIPFRPVSRRILPPFPASRDMDHPVRIALSIAFSALSRGIPYPDLDQRNGKREEGDEEESEFHHVTRLRTSCTISSNASSAPISPASASRAILSAISYSDSFIRSRATFSIAV